jgi:hypothetical protein
MAVMTIRQQIVLNAQAAGWANTLFALSTKLKLFSR